MANSNTPIPPETPPQKKPIERGENKEAFSHQEPLSEEALELIDWIGRCTKCSKLVLKGNKRCDGTTCPKP